MNIKVNHLQAWAVFALATSCASAPPPAPAAASASTQPVASAAAPAPAAPAAPQSAAGPAPSSVNAATTAAMAPPSAAPMAPVGKESGAATTPALTVAAAAPAGGQSLTDAFQGLRIEVPCQLEKFGENTECHWDPALLQKEDPRWKLKKEIVRTFGGQPGVTYDVKLRIRGVVEPKNFTGGRVDSEHFQRGGTPVPDDYNFYSIKVSDPEESYTVNRHVKKTGHFVFPIDYTVTIPVRGGAIVTVGAYDRNDISIANHKNIVVPKIPPAPTAFDGQFFQIDVVDVRKKP